ncbi:Ribosomal protein L1 [Entamoeba marina]
MGRLIHSFKSSRVRTIITPLETTDNTSKSKVKEQTKTVSKKKEQHSKPTHTNSEVQKKVVDIISEVPLKKYSELNRKHVESAVVALRKYVEAKEKEAVTASLFSFDKLFEIRIGFLKKSPFNKTIRRLTLPHPIKTNKTVCLICRNPKKTYKKRVETTGAQVTKVISTKQIRRIYSTHKLQLELTKKFDVFVCDGSVAHLLPSLLLPVFFSHKDVIPIPTSEALLKKSVEDVLNSTHFFPNTRGGVCGYFAATFSQENSEVVDNIVESLDKAKDFIPGGSENIRNVYLTTPQSISLPLFKAY